MSLLSFWIVLVNAQTESREYVLFSHSRPESKELYQSLVQELGTYPEFRVVRANVNLRHIYIELSFGAVVDESQFHSLLENYNILIGCYGLYEVSQHPLEYFDLSRCDEKIMAIRE